MILCTGFLNSRWPHSFQRMRSHLKCGLMPCFCNTCEDYKYYRKLIKSLSAEEIRSDLYPLFERRVRLLVQDCLDDSVWNLRKEKEDFSTAFFTDAFLGFYINYIRDHEEIDYNMLQIGLEFLFDKFLSTVRITKEESGEQK